jgi:aryl-alcohol dehydrogenase-like predicted oxidoreductase
MQQRALGTTSHLVSAIGLGAMPLAIEKRPDERSAIRVIHAALDAGITWIDVADSYCMNQEDVGYAERLVSRALEQWSGRRDTILVATKGGYVRPHGRWELDGRPAHLRAACEASLRALGLESIQLYQLHGPDPQVYFPDSVGALAQLRREGKIRHVGVCNVDVGHLRDAAEIVPIVSVQNRCNPYDRHSFSNGVIEWCERHHVAFIAHSPVGGHSGHVRIASDPVLTAVGQGHGVTPHQVALAWLLASSHAVLPIPGASRVSSVEASARAVDVRLDAQDLAELQRAFPRANVLVRQLIRARRTLRHWIRNRRTRPS